MSALAITFIVVGSLITWIVVAFASCGFWRGFHDRHFHYEKGDKVEEFVAEWTCAFWPITFPAMGVFWTIAGIGLATHWTFSHLIYSPSKSLGRRLFG